MQRSDLVHSEPTFSIAAALQAEPASIITMQASDLPEGSCLRELDATAFTLYRYERKQKPNRQQAEYRYAVVINDPKSKHKSLLGVGSNGSVFLSVATVKYVNGGTALTAKLKGLVTKNKLHVVKCPNTPDIFALKMFDNERHMIRLMRDKMGAKDSPGTYIVSKFIPGFLLGDLIIGISHVKYTTLSLLMIMREIFIQINDLHANYIIHQDVHYGNILLDGCHPVLFDFGQAVVFESNNYEFFKAKIYDLRLALNIFHGQFTNSIHAATYDANALLPAECLTMFENMVYDINRQTKPESMHAHQLSADFVVQTLDKIISIYTKHLSTLQRVDVQSKPEKFTLQSEPSEVHSSSSEVYTKNIPKRQSTMLRLLSIFKVNTQDPQSSQGNSNEFSWLTHSKQ